MATEIVEPAIDHVVNNRSGLLERAARISSRILLTTLFAITGSSKAGAVEIQNLLESNNPPLASLLQSGTSDEGGREFCQLTGLPHFVRTSPTSFICVESGPPVAEETGAKIPQEPFVLPELPTIPSELPKQLFYTVQPGDTFSQIIERHYGYDKVYGIDFSKTLLLNADLITQRNPGAAKFIDELRENPGWTPRTSIKTWRSSVQATRHLEPGDVIVFNK